MEYGKKGYLEGYEDGKNAAQQKSKELAIEFADYVNRMPDYDAKLRTMEEHYSRFIQTNKKGE